MKKSSIILSLLTLTAALASIPALGELAYLKKNTPYIEKVPIKKITSLVSNGHAKIDNLLDDNKNTEWISWQENLILTENYSSHKGFSDISVDNLITTSTTVGDGFLKVLAINTTPEEETGNRKWRQYRVFQGLDLSKDITYKLRLKYRGNIASDEVNNKIKVALGEYNPNESVEEIDVPTEWVVKEVIFKNLPQDITNGWCSIQPGYYPGIIEVDWAVLSYLDENAGIQPLYTYDYITGNHSFSGVNSENVDIETNEQDGQYLVAKTNTDWYQFPITADAPQLLLKPKTTYKVEIVMKGEKEGNGVRWWVGDKSSFAEYSTLYDLNYGTDWGTSELTFSTPENVSTATPAVIKIQPGSYPGKIQIRSVKIYEYPNVTNEGEPYFSGDNDENPKYTEVKDGIIYSNPLTDRRKIIVAYSEGEDGKKLVYQKDHSYAVCYNLKYSVDGTIQAELHKSGNTNPDDNIIGESRETKIIAGATQQIRSVAQASVDATTNPAVVLDLGYNVGDVEVSNLRVYDITTDIAPQNSSTNSTVTKPESQEFTGNMTTQLVEVMNDLTLHNNETYTVTVKLKATKAGSLCMKLGRAFPGEGPRRVVNQNFNGPGENATVSDWQLLTFTASPNLDDPENPLNYNGNGLLALQLQKPVGTDAYDGEVTIQVVKITSDRWEDGKEVCSRDFSKDQYPGDPFPASTYPKIEDGKLVVKEYNGNDIQFTVATGLGYIDQARTYKIYMTSKVTENENKDTKIRVLLGDYNQMAVKNELEVKATENYSTTDGILNDPGQYFTRPNNSFLLLQTRGTSGDIEIESLRVVQNANEQAVWFNDGEGTATGLAPNGNLYTNYKITNEGLVLNPQYNTKPIAENVNLTWGKQYPVSIDINAPAGDYVVSLGDGDVNDSKVITVPGGATPDADGFVHKELVFNSVPAENGKLTITPQQYVGSITIKNVSISEGTPAISAGDMIGTDFFTAELADGYTMKKDGDYFFLIGYVPFGDGLSNCTPKQFLIQGSTNGTNFRNIGTYEVQDRDKGNAYIGSVNNPVRNIPDGTKYLRFYCMDTEGDDYTTAVCYPSEQDANNKQNAYVGQMMRVTRFAIYRQDEITDPQGSVEGAKTWALPLLTRFQIEANGQQYAYPGARLRDMIGIHKAYTNTSELFGVDTRDITNGYWDTTLPYNKQDGVASEGGMNRDYAADVIDHEKSPYDCIDLSFPKLKELRAEQHDGHYQICISMAQAHGEIGETYPSYHIYDNTVEKRFLEKANGFPTEIEYQGFKTKADGSKELQGEKPIVMNLITYPESEPTFDNQTNNYNVANFALTVGEDWDGVRIWCRENVEDLERIHGTKTYGLEGSGRAYSVYKERIYDSTIIPNTRMMRFAAIQAYVEIPKIHLEGDTPYPYDLLYNSRENFKNYTWNHTRGIIADINNDNYVPTGQDWQATISDPANKADLEKHNIALPNFDYYATPLDDPNVSVSTGYDTKGKRQRTYTILHEVQVLPGERVDLYPQSDIWKTYRDIVNKDFGDGTGINYEEQFVRWYDYLTDNAPDYLYFFSEPKSVIKTKDFGFIGGKTLLDQEQRGLGTIASVYFKQSDWNAFENSSDKTGNKYFYQDDNNQTRLRDQWVAADFSLTFNTNLAQRLSKDATSWADKGTNTIDEPVVTFRHLFHLTSGKTFADENMATAEGNINYYTNNRRYLTSFGGKDFMIRLETDMPELKTTKSAYYYKDSKTGDYKRVRGFEIRTYENSKYDENNLTSAGAVTSAAKYDGTEISASDLLGTNTFQPIDRSKFSHITSDIKTDVDQSKWLRNNLNFYRAIGCNNPAPGTYVVRIYGYDENGKIIELPYTTDGKTGTAPLVIAEYYVTFLDPAKNEASFVSEETLKNEAEKYYTHTEEYLEGHFNKDGKSSLVVDFDNYTYLKDPKYSACEFFGDKSENITYKETVTDDETEEEKEVEKVKKTQTGSYLKLPIAWDDSNYGFGYTTRGDYNMFVLGDHSVITPYMDAARAVNDDDGTFDRLYYNKGGTQKGLFYYVNAASDPGDMAKIQFGELCNGSTIYVSAWVNEFNNGQEETANVIFNFYANISKKGDETNKIIRQDQIHGFVTGYINRGTYISAGNTNNYRDGDQGKWMHVYYTFVPDLTHAQYDFMNEEVKSYTLVLENNCISSSGADYAIDDIRAYVVEPRVEARQSTPVCNRKYPNDIEVEVSIPFSSLYESMKESIDNGKMQLQYSVMDKQKYDKYVEEHKNEDDVNINAFASSVLHYAHDNIKMSEGTPEKKPLSWGTIEFYDEFENNLKEQTDLNSWGEEIDQEQMLIFKTKLNSEGDDYSEFDTDHRDYYIVIGNLGSTKLFETIEGADLTHGTYNADIYPSKTDEGGKFTKADWEDYDKVLGRHYDFNSKCVRISDFTLKGASDIIVDGIVYNDVDNITCCENQRPVVQIDLYKMNNKEDREIITEAPDPDNKLRANPYIDWYYGSYEQFMDKTMDGTKTSLWQVLTIFRKAYPDATTWDVEPTVDFTQQMKDYLKKMCEPGTVTKEGKTVTTPAKVQLHTSSFIFPALTLKDEFGEPLKDAQGHILTSRDVYVTAIPDSNIEEDNPWGIICTEPTEIKITVSNTSPEMLNGFASGITYPADMDVVPLRSGLLYLDKTGIVDKEWKLEENTTTKKDQVTLDISDYENQETLVIPLRNLAVATQGVTKFKGIDGDPYCYLAESNDPYYRHLGQVMYEKPTSSSTGSGESETDTPAAQAENDAAGLLYDSEFGLTPRGVITIDANTGTDHFSNVKITFNKTDMQFHEGYYYTFKFAYEEDYSTEGVQRPNLAEDIPCNGQTLFTIKVVPEYQVWTGNTSLNWNNDENWSRVKKEDLLADSDVPYGKTDSRFTVNGGVNPNEFAYAPLDFTKVIIPAGTSYPQLAVRKHVREVTDEGVSVKNGHGDAVKYVWASATTDDPDSNAPKAATSAGNGDDKESAADVTYNADRTVKTPSYLPAKNVQYDMAAVMYEVETTTSTEEGTSTEKTYEPNVYCRPWYANACEQIHFNSNAEILNQQNLDYQKAWVDMEMKPDQWYNVASPLYGVVAGDMYLPTQGARQETELFTDIKYNTTLNDRFHPAVYQRGWDKGTEKVYNIEYTQEGSTLPGCPKVETVALASTWSHAYNDVAEEYAPGMGVSVKTDVSRYDESSGSNPKPDYVKFRFPKADETYTYFSDDDKTGQENGNELNRTGKHQLFAGTGDIVLTKATIKTAEGSEVSEPTLFLVGNPFMAHLDMAKFLDKNKGVIAQKYWLLSEGEGQVGVVLDHKSEDKMLTNETLSSGVNMTATSAASGRLAPMQGFFVQALQGKVQKDETTGRYTLGITFTPDMMAVQPYTDATDAPILKAPRTETRADGDDIIRVSTEESTAIIRLSGSADKGYMASEDVEMIDDSNQRGMRRVYTVAGTMASAINQTPDADGVEVGLMAPADSVTVVTFNGLALENYMLYDTTTGEKTQLYDGFELEMEGSVSGRYFLTNGVDTAEIEDGSIRIIPGAHEVVVKAPAVCGEFTVRVFDTLGREVAKAEGMEEEARIALDPGIYVVEAVGSDAGRKSAKIRIR